ncbi:MAG: hypothetical protein H0U27_09160 [Nitrosopumilus sp.]|nr:hypothetical protein [Nitrosopumilus sp.]
MKKLILNLIMPGAFLLISFNGISKTPVVTAEANEFIVPAVIYEGETIPSVNLPEMEIVSVKCDLKANNGSRPDKKKPIKRGPKYRKTT